MTMMQQHENSQLVGSQTNPIEHPLIVLYTAPRKIIHLLSGNNTTMHLRRIILLHQKYRVKLTPYSVSIDTYHRYRMARKQFSNLYTGQSTPLPSKHSIYSMLHVLLKQKALHGMTMQCLLVAIQHKTKRTHTRLTMILHRPLPRSAPKVWERCCCAFCHTFFQNNPVNLEYLRSNCSSLLHFCLQEIYVMVKFSNSIAPLIASGQHVLCRCSGNFV